MSDEYYGLKGLFGLGNDIRKATLRPSFGALARPTIVGGGHTAPTRTTIASGGANTVPPKPGMRFEWERDAQNEWRWALVAANNRTLADSGEGYKNFQDMMKVISLWRGTSPMPVVPSLKERQRRAAEARRGAR